MVNLGWLLYWLINLTALSPFGTCFLFRERQKLEEKCKSQNWPKRGSCTARVACVRQGHKTCLVGRLLKQITYVNRLFLFLSERQRGYPTFVSYKCLICTWIKTSIGENLFNQTICYSSRSSFLALAFASIGCGLHSRCAQKKPAMLCRCSMLP